MFMFAFCLGSCDVLVPVTKKIKGDTVKFHKHRFLGWGLANKPAGVCVLRRG